MATTATWLIILGFVLLGTGFVLRTVILMRSSDASATNLRPLHGRELMGQYRRVFPQSPAPLVTRWLLISGTVLLLSGLCIQFSR